MGRFECSGVVLQGRLEEHWRIRVVSADHFVKSFKTLPIFSAASTLFELNYYSFILSTGFFWLFGRFGTGYI
jgi:hypothetical protein